MTKCRALLLDRDGVINPDVGYIGSIERFSFMPGLFSFLRAVRDQGYRLAVTTNQAGVARGLYFPDDFERLNVFMLNAFKKEGIAIDLVLACFEHKDGTNERYARQSYWRKPNPGMILEAIRRLNLDPSRSAFIGDALTDMQAAKSGGIATRLWLTPDAPPRPEGVRLVRTFDEALAILKEP